MKPRHIALSVLACAAVLTAGCERFDMGPFFDDKNYITVSQATYGAADALATQAKNTISQSTVLVSSPVSMIGNPEATTLGKQIQNNVAARFVQLGYTVVETPPSGSYSTISGDYTTVRNDVLINLRITDMKRGQILAAHDYRMPLTNEVRDFIKADQPEDEEGGLKPLGNIFGESFAR